MSGYCIVKVKDKLKTFGYVGLFGGVVAGFGGIIYTLYTELSETSGSSYSLVQRAVTRIESDQRLMNYLGPGPLKVYGQSNRYGRRRPRVISRFLEDGTRCYDTSFWVESAINNRKCLVTLQVIESGADGKASGLKERFLAVELADRGGEKVILIQPPQVKSKFSWNPFSRLFSQ